ncbi:uncharacterized protein EKO05_0011298 [Ascochyta rabiei]|uniref:uncharacterized protein n=1 Tax=Didymella rabiei TaxID=5454 RepID=UPI0021FBC7D3|nr:uncharacterized protein EKO05_0011298 [Ascochyta rabiei]UPX21094.1 hypothetical protein EKO05_0011298 [Ascochyta rabiei]
MTQAEKCHSSLIPQRKDDNVSPRLRGARPDCRSNGRRKPSVHCLLVRPGNSSIQHITQILPLDAFAIFILSTQWQEVVHASYTLRRCNTASSLYIYTPPSVVTSERASP